MASTSPTIRQPVVAGRFYDADPMRCAAEVKRLSADAGAAGGVAERLVGGIVPHAGWVCSGRVAGRVWSALAASPGPMTVFLTGSVHTMDLAAPALDEADAWQTPLGPIEIDAALRDAVAALDGFGVLHAAHVHEHAVEVQLPMIQHAFGERAKIVPCMIPPRDAAPRWGEAVGRLLRDWDRPTLVVASCDLTHYGVHYGFAPQGIGPAGCQWALRVNDRRLLDLVEQMSGERIVGEAEAHQNTCGAGAMAAAVAAARQMGATRGRVLEHTNSTAALQPLGHADPDNSVGYAGVVFA